MLCFPSRIKEDSHLAAGAGFGGRARVWAPEGCDLAALNFLLETRQSVGPEQLLPVPAPTSQAEGRLGFIPQPWWLCLLLTSMFCPRHLPDSFLRAQRAVGSALGPEQGWRAVQTSSLLWRSQGVDALERSRGRG